jgi:hypothetical protein
VAQPRTITAQTDTPITDATAEVHEAALEAVRMLLSARSVHTHSVSRIGLTLEGSGPPYPRNRCVQYAPELLVFAPQGWLVATVSVLPRSGEYLLALTRTGADDWPQADLRRMIPANRPDLVAGAIPTGDGEIAP